MDRYKRNLVLDIFDYSGHRLCGLYDSSMDVNGQAVNVSITTERNGWKELKFELPSVCTSESGPVPNHRLQYLKADYRIRAIDDDGIDWFIISEPKVVHNAFSSNLTITAGHRSQILKTKNLGLEFSDEEGNNVGTAKELLTTILNGTGWKPGYVEEFLEKDEKTIKRRSLKAATKTGAFKLIGNMCKLFDAKPIFHGDSCTVDIVAMNPFSEPEDGSLPDVSKADGVLELHYGHSVSNVTRTQNTDNLVTKLYAYGSYGDKVTGYCGIEECVHDEYVFTLTEDIQAGVPYVFTVETFASREFTPTQALSSGSRLIWSMLDVTSSMYVWDESNRVAYPVKINSVSNFTDEYGNVLYDPNFSALSSNALLPATVTKTSAQNWFSYLTDFSYYHNVGLLTNEMLQSLAEFQRGGAEAYRIAHEAQTAYLESLNTQSNLVGNFAYCKLNIGQWQNHEGNLQLILPDDQVAYRTDYGEKVRNYFRWTPATQVDDKGDPTNDVASVVYIIHPPSVNTRNLVTWDKIYIKSFNTDIVTAQDGEEQAEITSIEFWAAYDTIDVSENDSVYLFSTSNINGLLGSWEVSDEAKTMALAESTKIVTADHPVYFCEYTLPVINTDDWNGYAWAWQYDSSGERDSRLYFYFGDGSGESYGDKDVNGDLRPSSWVPVYYQGTIPPTDVEPAYWYNWADLEQWTSSTLYALIDGKWVVASNDVINYIWTLTGESGQKDIPYDIADTWKHFGVVYNTCRERDRLYQGYKHYYTYEVTGLESDTPDYLPKGNYYIDDPYGDYLMFTTKENLPAGSTLSYDAFNSYIIQKTADGVETTIETKKYPFDAVRYNLDVEDMVIANKEHFLHLHPVTGNGDHRGIIEFVRQFQTLSDYAYQTLLTEYKDKIAVVDQKTNEMIEMLGDLYREGWWQSDNYVEGDNDKLYEDALENLKKIAQPDATYQITFLDRYGSQENMEYGASELTASLGFPDIKIMTAVHLVDPEIAVNVWAYVDKLIKCYDKPWETKLTINTNLTTIGQHSFTDVLTNIANVAKEIDGNMSGIKRAQVISPDGTLATEYLNGAIDASKTKIFGGNSTWYTDEAGNLMFVSADNTSAMTLTGNGFSIANSKDEWGNWNWRTFGTGDGFTADEIVAGFISADRIQANSISSYKLDPNTQGLLGWVEGAVIDLAPDKIKMTVTETMADEMNSDSSALRQSIIEQTTDSVRIEFQEMANNYDALAETNDELKHWFSFSEDGLKIGASTDGSDSNCYTLQTNTEYGFYNQDDEKVAHISGSEMHIPQANVSTQFRIGNQLAIVDEDDGVNWIYTPNT